MPPQVQCTPRLGNNVTCQVIIEAIQNQWCSQWGGNDGNGWQKKWECPFKLMNCSIRCDRPWESAVKPEPYLWQTGEWVWRLCSWVWKELKVERGKWAAVLAVRSTSWWWHEREMMCSANGMCGVNQTWSENGNDHGPEGMHGMPESMWNMSKSDRINRIWNIRKITRKFGSSGIGHMVLGPRSLQGLWGS